MGGQGGLCHRVTALSVPTRSDFLSLPFQAIECSLAGIKPAGELGGLDLCVPSWGGDTQCPSPGGGVTSCLPHLKRGFGGSRPSLGMFKPPGTQPGDPMVCVAVPLGVPLSPRQVTRGTRQRWPRSSA